MVLELISNMVVVRTASVDRSLKIHDLYMAELGGTPCCLNCMQYIDIFKQPEDES